MMKLFLNRGCIRVVAVFLLLFAKNILKIVNNECTLPDISFIV